ncbi:hypothetical protein TWF481_007909 [Arthrobotrys musiformis]|uniref:Fungal-type protein kinase domain-containing protein n=1 Tax=Arthrobotrys musiformis TaxID=47236 RepID=A0AAV9W7R2_9PEZI
MQLSEFLEAITAPQLIICEPMSAKKTTKPAHPREYASDLTEWVGIKEEVKGFLDSKLSFESPEFMSADFIRADAGRATSCSDESDVISLASIAYEGPALVVLRECFGIIGRFCNNSASYDPYDPTRVFVVKETPTERGREKLVLEWRTPWDLTTPDDLIEEFNSGRLRDGRPTKLVKAVSKLYGYMTYNNLRFGALCNYESLYLFQRVGDSGLQVSPPFKFSDRGTESPVAALVYLCHHVVTVGSFHYSTIEQGPPGPIFSRSKISSRGAWKERGNTEIMWERMKLYLTERVMRDVAAVMLGEV